MKRQLFAFTTGAALIASLLAGGAMQAQAQTDVPQEALPAAASGTSSEQILERATAQAPAAADVPVAAPDGIEPVDVLAQPATADSDQAAITPASDAAGVSKANAAKDLNGQVELATAPSDLSQAPTAKNATDQVVLASEPGNSNTAVDSK